MGVLNLVAMAHSQLHLNNWSLMRGFKLLYEQLGRESLIPFLLNLFQVLNWESKQIKKVAKLRLV